MTKVDSSMVKNYIQLIKPGYIISNCLTALAGFFLASKGYISFPHLALTLSAIALGLASVCIANNYIDKHIDSKMKRTEKRALVTGVISSTQAIMLAAILSIVSVLLFIFFTNIVTLLVGAIGVFFYLVLYSVFKRCSTWSTVIGSIPGGVVPLAGYTAVMGQIDTGAILLFLLLVFWQMPHFYAISIYRRNEYQAAGIPLLSVVKGISMTKVHILFYTIAFGITAILLFLTGYAGKTYLWGLLLLSFLWVLYACWGFLTKNTITWAKRMFFFSLIVNIVFCVLVIITPFTG